jgi:hypothetical protein
VLVALKEEAANKAASFRLENGPAVFEPMRREAAMAGLRQELEARI